VSIPPPLFLSLGIPAPANMPPNCGAANTDASSPPGAMTPPSLLLLARFGEDPAGTGGVKLFLI
jgi:hypothetical protein